MLKLGIGGEARIALVGAHACGRLRSSDSPSSGPGTFKRVEQLRHLTWPMCFDTRVFAPHRGQMTSTALSLSKPTHAGGAASAFCVKAKYRLTLRLARSRETPAPAWKTDARKKMGPIMSAAESQPMNTKKNAMIQNATPTLKVHTMRSDQQQPTAIIIGRSSM
mmetsp:Transcript_29187/g.77103  ORF Transcript_29187/g.77103 Transcript_29187/m.77103 type:complete len:164 (+) Transcript_29187:138-629(+)